jgi:hypothetical protein
MAEAHLDHPGEIHWFKSEMPRPVIGPCPHTECEHLGQGVIAWGPSMERYELVECGSGRKRVPGECNAGCRAWIDGRGRVVTPWLMVGVNE